MPCSFFPPKCLVVTVSLLLWTNVATLRVCFPSLNNGRKKLRNSHMTLRTEENSACHFLIFFCFLHMHICFTLRGDVQS